MSRDALGDKLVSAALWAAGVSWLVPSLGSLMVLQSLVDPDRLEWLSRLAARGQILLTGSSWRAVVHPEVDPHTPYMFCQNHINHFDYCTMYRATPHFKQGLELEEHFRYPVYGWFMRQRGTIPVARSASGQSPAVMARMREEIEKGHSLLVFPEGTRTRDGRVGPFHRGVFYIARDLSIPIVPVAVTGMQEVMRADSWIIRPGRTITVFCERPVITEGIADERIDEVVERVRAPIKRRVDEYWESRRRL